MQDIEKVAIVIGSAIGIGALAYLYSTSKTQPGTKLSLSAYPSVIEAGQNVDFKAVLEANNVPIPNKLINLSTPGMNYTQETSTDGTADFSVQFNTPGTYTIFATE
jgi:hypothetical protein